MSQGASRATPDVPSSFGVIACTSRSLANPVSACRPGAHAAWRSAAAAVAAFVCACAATADTELCEDRYGDAGSLPTMPLRPPGTGPITAINGQLGVFPLADGGRLDTEDMYLLQILDPAAFQAQTVVGLQGGMFNTALWLFDACGNGLLANDDSFKDPSTGFSLLLPHVTPPDRTGVVLAQPGLYHLAISGGMNLPLSPGGSIFFFQDPTEISGPDGPGGNLPINAWIENPVFEDYRIELSGVYFLGMQSMCPADLNGDTVIDGADLGQLLALWGLCPPGGCPADLTHDGMVDGADIGVLLAAWGACPPAVGTPCGDPGAGDCFEEHKSAGCENACCCTLVCSLDPSCCNESWDLVCVEEAIDACGGPSCQVTCVPGAIPESEPCGADRNGGCNAPPVSTCCSTSADPGCDDLECQSAVCAVDGFCCKVAWDEACAVLATDLCAGLCAVSPALQPIDCGEMICGTVWAAEGTRDTDWYEFVTETPVSVTLGVDANIPMIVGVIDTGGIPDCALATQLHPFAFAAPCATGTVTICLGPGTWWFFAAPTVFEGFECQPGSSIYRIWVQCDGPCTPVDCGSPDAGDCFSIHEHPYCDDLACCTAVCGADILCCSQQWDVVCVTLATKLCDAASSCCVANRGPGCDDLGCELEVCLVDDFCCMVVWDGICAEQAARLCDVCGGGVD